MSFDEDRERFALRAHLLAMTPAYQRWCHQRSCVITAWECKCAGDEAGYQLWTARADAALTEPAEAPPPPLSFAGTPRSPEESPE